MDRENPDELKIDINDEKRCFTCSSNVGEDVMDSFSLFVPV
jgi:hypothetical protein